MAGYSEDLQDGLEQELIAVVRSGLGDQELKQAKHLQAVLDERLGPSDSPVERAHQKVLAAIDALERPDHRRALRALCLHPYEDDLLKAPELRGRMFRKNAKDFAARICDHRASPGSVAGGYSTKWVEEIEKNEFVPELTRNIRSGKFADVHAQPVGGAKWTNMRVSVSISVQAGRWHFTEEWTFATPEAAFVLAVCAGVSRSASLLTACDDVSDVWVTRSAHTALELTELAETAYRVGARTHLQSAVEWLELLPLEGERVAQLLSGVPVSSRSGIALLAAEYPPHTLSVTVRRRTVCDADSHHYYWVSDRELDLKEFVVDMTSLSQSQQRQVWILPFLAKYSTDSDLSTDRPVLDRVSVLVEGITSAGNGVAIVW